MTQLYTSSNLPAFKPNTQGWAKPRPSGTVAAVLLPVNREFVTSWGTLTGLAGKHYHQVKDVTPDKVDEYPNDCFEEDFKILQELKRGDDPRGDRLLDLYGDDAKVVLATKTKPVIVLGVSDVEGQFVTSESSKEKPYAFKEGHWFLTNLARTRYWCVSAEKTTKLYDDEGIRPGEPEVDNT